MHGLALHERLCPGCRSVETKNGRQKEKPGWLARFLMASSWMRLHRNAARRELALKLPLAGLGPLRLPGSCSFRPVPDCQSQDHSVQVEDSGSWETAM